MARFGKKGKKDLPPISTASLPDIIFILLFFFMVVTVMRETELKVEVKVPNATELTKLEKKSAVSYIYIGKPTKKYQSKLGTAPRIQLNDKFAKVEDIPAFVDQEISETREGLRGILTFALNVDQEVKMGLVSDVKQELRKSNALKISYTATPAAEK